MPVHERDGDLERELRGLEERHLRHDVRSSPEALRALLAEEFVEFGSSGRIFDRAAAVAGASTQAPFQSRIDAFTARAFSPDVALTTYRLSAWSASERDARISLRSSLWLRRDGQWLLVFHQGTPVRPGDK